MNQISITQFILFHMKLEYLLVCAMYSE
uniref:Uncharacterized protein n=1 Tax=Rhizophora mucronata TaxID=61149 RepID=A0A2P2NBV3_RHIMU